MLNPNFNKRIISVSIILLAFMMSYHGNAQSVQERVYMKIEIKGLACPYCAFGMEKELKKIAGVDSVEIILKKGLAFISTPSDKKPHEEDIRRIISEAGFTPGIIEFSEHEFEENLKK